MTAAFLKNLPELLSPAGDIDKALTAYHYGADTIYLGFPSLGLRTRSKNFSIDQYHYLIHHAKENNRSVYLTLNAYLFSTDYPYLKQVIEQIQKNPPDAIILSDLWLLKELRTTLNIPFHISTQAGITTTQEARFWKDQGAARVILARQLSLEEIESITNNSGIETEVFIHGALCWGLSGYCHLSSYIVSRDSNRGDCAHPCRWEYCYNDQSKQSRFSFNMNDLVGLEFIPKLCDIGVASLKIEGRTKSALYCGLITSIYREALDIYADSPTKQEYSRLIAQLTQRLHLLSNRNHTPGFFTYGHNQWIEHQSAHLSGALAMVGIIKQSFNREALCLIKQTIEPEDNIALLKAGGLLQPISLNAIIDLQRKPLTRVLANTLAYIIGADINKSEIVVRINKKHTPANAIINQEGN